MKHLLLIAILCSMPAMAQEPKDSLLQDLQDNLRQYNDLGHPLLNDICTSVCLLQGKNFGGEVMIFTKDREILCGCVDAAPSKRRTS